MFFLKNFLLFQTLRQKRSEKGKFFRLCSLNCIILQKKLILRKCFLRFEELFCHFRTFSKNISERLWKLLSMSLEDRFGKKGFFFKNCSFFHASRNWIKHFLDFRQKKLVWWPNFRWMNPEEYFEETMFSNKKSLSFSYFEPNTSAKWQIFLLRSINCIIRDHSRFFGKFSWVSSSYSIYFGLLAKTNRSVCQNCFLWAVRIVLGKKKIYFEKFVFHVFRIWIDHFLHFWQKKLIGWPKCGWKSPGEHSDNIVFLKKFLLFQTLRQKRSEKGKFFRLCSLNCIILQKKLILRKCFLRFEELFCHFRTFSKNISERLSKLLSMSLEDRFGKKGFFSKIVVFSMLLGTGSNISWTFDKKNLVWWPNFRWMNPEEYFEETMFSKKKSLSFSYFEPNTSGKWQIFLLRSINCIIRDHSRFFGKFSWVSSSYSIYFGLLAKTIRSVCQNCFLWALRIVLRKGIYFEKFVYHVFRIWIDHFLHFWQKKLIGWPKCGWKSPGEHSENNVFFEKFSSFSDFETKTFGKGQIFSAVFSKLHNTSKEAHPKEIFSQVWGTILSFSDF